MSGGGPKQRRGISAIPPLSGISGHPANGAKMTRVTRCGLSRANFDDGGTGGVSWRSAALEAGFDAKGIEDLRTSGAVGKAKEHA